MKVCEVNFGGEIGTRPAVILKNKGNRLDVLKITTKAKSTDFNKIRLSGFSGVKGYVVTNCVYNVSKNKIKRYTNKLFDCEVKNIFKNVNKFNNNGQMQHVDIIG